MRRPALQTFTPDCYAAMLGNEGARIAQSVNALSLSAAIVHASELIDRKIKSDRRVFRYFLTDIGVSLTLTVVELTANKIASIDVRGPLGFGRTPLL